MLCLCLLLSCTSASIYRLDIWVNIAYYWTSWNWSEVYYGTGCCHGIGIRIRICRHNLWRISSFQQKWCWIIDGCELMGHTKYWSKIHISFLVFLMIIFWTVFYICFLFISFSLHHLSVLHKIYYLTWIMEGPNFINRNIIRFRPILKFFFYTYIFWFATLYEHRHFLSIHNTHTHTPQTNLYPKYLGLATRILFWIPLYQRQYLLLNHKPLSIFSLLWRKSFLAFPCPFTTLHLALYHYFSQVFTGLCCALLDHFNWFSLILWLITNGFFL